MALEPSVLGGAVIAINNSANQPHITCNLVVPKGMDASGLECVVQAIHPISAAETWTIVGAVLGIVGVILLAVHLLERRSEKRWQQRYNKSGKEKRFRK